MPHACYVYYIQTLFLGRPYLFADEGLTLKGYMACHVVAVKIVVRHDEAPIPENLTKVSPKTAEFLSLFNHVAPFTYTSVLSSEKSGEK